MFKSILLVFGIIVASLFVLGCLATLVLYICFNGSGLDNNGSTNWKSKRKLRNNVEIDKDAIELFKKRNFEMTVRKLRDRLNELIAKDESYGDAPVYYDDAELNLRPIDAEEVHVVQAIQQPSFRHEHLNPGDIFCSLNINRYDCEELDYWTGGAMVIPPDFLKNRREEVMKYIAEFIADTVFKYNYAMDFDRQFKNVQYNDETKARLKIFFQDFGDKVEDEFFRKWNEELSRSFTLGEVARIRELAKKVPFRVELSGNKEDIVSF